MFLMCMTLMVLDTSGFTSWGPVTLAMVHTFAGAVNLTIIAACGKLLHWIDGESSNKDALEDEVASGKMLNDALA